MTKTVSTTVTTTTTTTNNNATTTTTTTTTTTVTDTTKSTTENKEKFPSEQGSNTNHETPAKTNKNCQFLTSQTRRTTHINCPCFLNPCKAPATAHKNFESQTTLNRIEPPSSVTAFYNANLLKIPHSSALNPCKTTSSTLYNANLLKIPHTSAAASSSTSSSKEPSINKSQNFTTWSAGGIDCKEDDFVLVICSDGIGVRMGIRDLIEAVKLNFSGKLGHNCVPVPTGTGCQIMGSCNGVVALITEKFITFWNPYGKEHLVIKVPDLLKNIKGFCFCNNDGQPYLVIISELKLGWEPESKFKSKFYVFDFALKKWDDWRIEGGIRFGNIYCKRAVLVKKKLYWLNGIDILEFDISEKVFRNVSLPENLIKRALAQADKMVLKNRTYYTTVENTTWLFAAPEGLVLSYWEKKEAECKMLLFDGHDKWYPLARAWAKNPRIVPLLILSPSLILMSYIDIDEGWKLQVMYKRESMDVNLPPFSDIIFLPRTEVRPVY